MNTTDKQKLIDLIAEKANVPAGSITNDTTWPEIGVDSLDGIELFMAVEKEFSISIPDTDMPMIETVGQLEQYIDGLYEK